MTATRIPKAKVTNGELSRLAKFLRAMDAKIALAEIKPDGTYKVVTTDGAGLTLGDEEASLDEELRKHMAEQQNGHGRA